MGRGAPELAQLVREELSRPAPPAARRLAEAIRARVGPAAAAVVFYGSCLRRDTDEGVFDFYVLVDDYASACGSRWLAWASRALPPSVFYIETPGEGGTLRAKYALLTAADFVRGASPGGYRSGIWARFCQPALAAWVRDEAAREVLVEACSRSVRTAVETVAPLLADPASPEQFWQRVFHETYRREMRAESMETIRSLHAADPERYELALHHALRELEAEGFPGAKWEAGRFRLETPPADGAARRFRRRLPWAKLVYVAQLFKTAFTFGDWLPYALWKVERHGGRPVVYSERQRRHPLIFGWPLLFQVLRRRDLR